MGAPSNRVLASRRRHDVTLRAAVLYRKPDRGLAGAGVIAPTPPPPPACTKSLPRRGRRRLPPPRPSTQHGGDRYAGATGTDEHALINFHLEPRPSRPEQPSASSTTSMSRSALSPSAPTHATCPTGPDASLKPGLRQPCLFDTTVTQRPAPSRNLVSDHRHSLAMPTNRRNGARRRKEHRTDGMAANQFCPHYDADAISLLLAVGDTAMGSCSSSNRDARNRYAQPAMPTPPVRCNRDFAESEPYGYTTEPRCFKIVPVPTKPTCRTRSDPKEESTSTKEEVPLYDYIGKMLTHTTTTSTSQIYLLHSDKWIRKV